MAGVVYVFLAVLLPVAWASYRHVIYLRFEQYKDLPRPPPSLIWGNLATIAEFTKKGDPRRHIDHVFRQIGLSLSFPNPPPIVVLDMRPFFWVMCLVFSHDVAEQVARASKQWPHSTPKSPTMEEYVAIIGSHSIIAAQGDYWKSLRKRYNAGFAPSHLMTLLPRILDKTSIFLDNLDALARSGEEFKLEPLCTSLTFDIIGTVVMDVDLNAQLPAEHQGGLVRLFRELIETYGNPGAMGFIILKPFLYLQRKRASRAVDQTLKDVIREKFSEIKEKTLSGSSKARSVLELSLQDTDKLDPLVLQQTADQLKSFLFAGHDTTSILLQWTFYELSRTPAALASLRAEHDSLFGKDASPEHVADVLNTRGDEVVTQMTYTSAVIKEALRLYPPAGAARRCVPGTGFFVRLPESDGVAEREVCMDGMVMYNMHSAIQRDPAVYGETADIFMPERWLGNIDTHDKGEVADDASDTDGAEKKGIPASAWRPFERGPRNCIGQELANIEARVILALTVRRYDFEKVGVGRIKQYGEGVPPKIDTKTGQYVVEDEMFNTRQVTSKPFDGMMVKVKMRG